MTSGQREEPATRLRGRLDQLWGWAKSGKHTDGEGGKHYLMAVENVDGFTDAVLTILQRERDAAVSALDRVRQLHARWDPAPSNPVAPYMCRTCNEPWPCPTVAALPPVDSPEDPNA